MRTVKAAVCHEFGKPLKIEQVALRGPEAGEIEVDIAACAICHSDISYIDGGWGGTLPAVYGHEAAGRVTALGEGVSEFKIGDSVLVTLMRACGNCRNCKSGESTLCEIEYDRDHGPLTTASGGVLQQGLLTGGFAEKAVVDSSQAIGFPDSIPMADACLLSCGVITGVGAVVNTAKLRPGDTAAVIGAGGIGLNAIQGAYISGASKIIAVDLSEEKLEAARDFGATHGVLASSEKPHRKIKEITGGRGVDFAFVTVGAIPAFDTAMKYLATGGKMIMVGMPHTGQMSSYEPVMVSATRQHMVGSLMGDTVLKRDAPWLVDLHLQGRLKLGELVSGKWGLEQINEAIADTKSGKARRNVIVMD